MGRELIVQLRKDKEILFDDYVCGRDDATNYIAQLIYDKQKDRKEPEDSDEEAIQFYYSLQFKLCTDYKLLSSLRETLADYAAKDNEEISKANETLCDLRIARRNTHTLKDFNDFTEAIQTAQMWIDEDSFSRAQILLDLIDKAVQLASEDLLKRDGYLDKDQETNIKYDNYLLLIILSE